MTLPPPPWPHASQRFVTITSRLYTVTGLAFIHDDILIPPITSHSIRVAGGVLRNGFGVPSCLMGHLIGAWCIESITISIQSVDVLSRASGGWWMGVAASEGGWSFPRYTYSVYTVYSDCVWMCRAPSGQWLMPTAASKRGWGFPDTCVWANFLYVFFFLCNGFLNNGLILENCDKVTKWWSYVEDNISMIKITNTIWMFRKPD